MLGRYIGAKMRPKYKLTDISDKEFKLGLRICEDKLTSTQINYIIQSEGLNEEHVTDSVRHIEWAKTRPLLVLLAVVIITTTVLLVL